MPKDLSQADIADFRSAVERLRPESVAIILLFSYLNDGAEQALAKALPAELFVSRSSEMLPVTGEYERGIATWLNAWVGPMVPIHAKVLSALGMLVTPPGRLLTRTWLASGWTVQLAAAGNLHLDRA